jgi:hypothetical protein
MDERLIPYYNDYIHPILWGNKEQFMRKARFTDSLALLLLVVLLVLLPACSGAGQPAPGGQENAGDSIGAATPSSGGQSPTPRTELAASDPDSVVLAAGQPQLVEFFAFW